MYCILTLICYVINSLDIIPPSIIDTSVWQWHRLYIILCLFTEARDGNSIIGMVGKSSWSMHILGVCLWKCTVGVFHMHQCMYWKSAVALMELPGEVRQTFVEENHLILNHRQLSILKIVWLQLCAMLIHVLTRMWDCVFGSYPWNTPSFPCNWCYNHNTIEFKCFFKNCILLFSWASSCLVEYSHQATLSDRLSVCNDLVTLSFSPSPPSWPTY